ncbi:unnamed protein product [Cylindrotheca closterium]|uniref:Amino acid transporter transmembrane domain-containing protein n=1 Tax=Cylindrotheca closterium TaxID=2856 RepID=A0AAD2FBB5_9STRA|nr:unnamed protein product [Cylindrotheca closterium]
MVKHEPLEKDSTPDPTLNDSLVVEMTSPSSESLDDLSPLIVNGGSSAANDGVAVPLSNRPKPTWFRQMSRDLSEGWATHIGSIGYLGSVSIAVNSLTGPAMLNLPDTFQRAGLIPTTLTLIFVAVLSSLCCLHMSNTISKVTGNSSFRKEIEYSEAFEAFWGHKSFIATQILFFLCISCLNISSIVDTAQVVDTFLGHWFPGGSAALYMYWEDGPHFEFIRWSFHSCSRDTLKAGDCVPFADDDDVGHHFTIGYVMCVLVFLPMALMDLKENAAWQVLGFAVLLVCSLIFVIIFILEGLNTDYISLWGTSWNTLFGVILFNYALVLAVPAWLYEKEPTVDVPKVVNGSAVLSTILYVLIGGLGAMTMPHASQNMLESMMSGTFGITMQICASVFAFFIVGLGIPLFCVLKRMNLTGRNLLSRNKANLFAVYLPFAISWLFYTGDWVTQLLSWGGMVFTSLVAFILPVLIALHTLDETDELGSVLVYGRFDLKEKSSQAIALKVLLVLSVLASIAALIGNVLG